MMIFKKSSIKMILARVGYRASGVLKLTGYPAHKSVVIDTNVDGGRSLRNFLYCCNLEQNAKVYELPTFGAWKRLYFLDECVFCGRTIASLQECDREGNIKILKRYIGKRAVEFRDKILKTRQLFSMPSTGSLANERTLYNSSGDILNFNGRKVTTNEEIINLVKLRQ